MAAHIQNAMAQGGVLQLHAGGQDVPLLAVNSPDNYLLHSQWLVQTLHTVCKGAATLKTTKYLSEAFVGVSQTFAL